MPWMTRKQVRSQPVVQESEEQLKGLLGSYDRRMSRLNDQYLRMMGEHIRDIGTLWPSDVHRLQQIRRMNKNLNRLEKRIAAAAGSSAEDIERVFTGVANADARMQTKVLGVSYGVDVQSNPSLRNILRAQSRETAGRMKNLSNTTVVSSYYRRAVDEACTAVQSGVEDYNTAIRRVIREAGQHGLRVRDDGSKAVEYESGYSRRLDSAARMNVLDGVRHLNQTVMNEVSSQFGANGVEIDAHMNCAEDHLPYQGGQYSNEDFELIQDGLPRPFGEWNCTHSWHGIILGVSPPAYSQEELSQMREYSTEPITIDGRTKTRYQWSQEMRRCETAVRQQKDCATLARYTGDEALRRQCQERIGALNRHYDRLGEQTGLKGQLGRTYVPGFRDAKDAKALTNGASGGTISSDSVSHWHAITPESVGSVPRFTEFGSPEINEAVRKACIEILTDMKDAPLGTEESVSLCLSDLTKEKAKGEPGSGAVEVIDLKKPYIAIHNHPSNETLSLADADLLGARMRCVGIVAIGNNGRNAYSLVKDDSYDNNGFATFRALRMTGLVEYKTDDEFLKEADVYGVHYTARTD